MVQKSITEDLKHTISQSLIQFETKMCQEVVTWVVGDGLKEF